MVRRVCNGSQGTTSAGPDARFDKQDARLFNMPAHSSCLAKVIIFVCMTPNPIDGFCSLSMVRYRTYLLYVLPFAYNTVPLNGVGSFFMKTLCNDDFDN